MEMLNFMSLFILIKISQEKKNLILIVISLCGIKVIFIGLFIIITTQEYNYISLKV